jgi:type IV fimbrial biogenesis protein FimT
MHPMHKGQRGFTIVELMVVILIIAVLAGIAVPTFRQYTRSSRVTATQNDLITALSFARSEALKRSIAVSVCPSADGTSCSGSAATGWLSGWIAFTDNTGAPGFVDAGANGDEVLQVWPALTGDVTLVANSTYVQYQPVGTAQFSVAPPGTFDIAWTNCTGKFKHHLSVMFVGSPRAELMSCP